MLMGTLDVAGAAGRSLASWPLDEGAGQVAADASGHGHTGTLGLGPSADQNDPTWVPGRAGTALRFDGARDERVTIAEASSLTPERLTVAAWVRRLGDPGTYRYILSYGATSCARGSYGLYSGVGGGIAFYVSSTDGYVTSPAAEPSRVWDGAWHQAAGTFDGAVVRLYLDGEEVGAGRPADLSIDYSLGASAYVGTFRGSCDLPFTGDVDEVSIDDTALGRTAIAALGAGLGPLPPQLPPVSGPPAGGDATSGANGASPETVPSRPSSTSRAACASVKVSRRSVRVGRRTPVVVTVRDDERGARRRTVIVRGAGIWVSARTSPRTDRVLLRLRPRRRGTLRVLLGGDAPRCARPTIRAR